MTTEQIDLAHWKALIAEYDAGQKHWPDQEQPCTISLADARAAVAAFERNELLEVALTGYGDHLRSCALAGGCTCGWSAVRAALELGNAEEVAG